MNTMFRGLSILWLTAALAGPAQARLITFLNEIENPGVPVKQPYRILTFSTSGTPGHTPFPPPTDTVNDIALSTDGSQLVFTQDTGVLNAWWVVVWAWPEIVLTMVGLIVPYRLWRTFRKRRRFPAERGPYCAKCAYETRQLTCANCPECGKALANKGSTPGVRRGRSWLRAACLLAVAALLGGGYWLTDPPRSGTANFWFNWRSEALASWARDQNIVWMTRLTQPATAVRSAPVNSTSQVNTITLLPRHNTPDDWIGVMMDSIIINASRPFPNDIIHTNADQTFAAVSTQHFAARIDLATLQAQDAPQFVRRSGAFSWQGRVLNDEGQSSYQLEQRWNLNDPSERVNVTAVHTEQGELSFTTESRELFTIRARAHDYHRHFIDSHAGVETAEELAELPYRPKSIWVQTITLDDGAVLRRGMSSQGMLTYIANGYLVILSHGMIYLYDLDADQWVAALDPTKVHSVGTMDGAATALSADRRWFAVRSGDGKRVALYRLPEPAKRPDTPAPPPPASDAPSPASPAP